MFYAQFDQVMVNRLYVTDAPKDAKAFKGMRAKTKRNLWRMVQANKRYAMAMRQTGCIIVVSKIAGQMSKVQHGEPKLIVNPI